MQKADLQIILDAVHLMASLEGAMAEFYRICGQVQRSASEPWLELEQQERRHAEHLARMASLISECPDNFERLRNFNPAAIRTFITYVKSTTARLRRNELPAGDLTRLLSTAYDMEQSILESRYGEIVRSTDSEYQALVGQIVADTAAHRARLAGLLAERRTASPSPFVDPRR